MSKISQPKNSLGAKGAVKTLYRLVKEGFKGNKNAMPLIYIALFFVALVPFLNNYFDSKVIDQIIQLIKLDAADRNLNTLIMFSVGVVILTVAEKLLWAVVSYLEKIIYFGSVRHFTWSFIDHASRLDMYHYENQKTNILIKKAQDIYDWKPREALNRTFWISADIVRIISSIIIVFSFSAPAFLLVLVTTAPGLIANIKMGKDSWGIWDADTNIKYKYWWTKDMLSKEDTLMEVRISNARGFLINMTNSIYDSFMNRERRNQLKRTLIESFLGNLSTLGILGFWIIAIKSALDGDITVGLLTFYVGAMYRFSDALGNFFRRVSQEYEDLLYVSDFFKFMDLKNNIKSGNTNLETSTPPTIEFKNVSFRYPDTEKDVIKNMDLKINSGEKVAFVGINGAGKTTIIKLLCRFYDVTGGEVLIDGIPLKQLNTESWYRKIGVLFQSFAKYGQFSVMENIEIGDIDKKSSLELINDAIFRADAKSFIDEYDNKLDQILDKSFEGGVDPSGGQWQRIALARAFFRDAPILILDEPTSAIDSEAEYEIFQRLYEFTKDKTVVIISHRFSTVRQADRIFVIDKGQVEESGTHDELLKLNGHYAKAFKTQAKGYA